MSDGVQRDAGGRPLTKESADSPFKTGDSLNRAEALIEEVREAWTALDARLVTFDMKLVEAEARVTALERGRIENAKKQR